MANIFNKSADISNKNVNFAASMKKLSILIPTYNDECYELVEALCRQAGQLATDYEVIVGDDGSTDQHVLERNRRVNSLPHCRVAERPSNQGRAAIRNFLAREAKYDWLLFIDSDMTVCRDDYVSRYAEAEGDVVYGGLVVRSADRHNLRARYEASRAWQHELERRRAAPYQDFHTANFMVRKEMMEQHPFDERFTHYGYEDVLLGKTLQQAGIGINHIDNPLSFEIFETNEAFVCKTEEGLRTLRQFSQELRGYSRLLNFAERHPVVARLVAVWHRLAGKWERRQLCSNAPTLFIFTLYRLGYFLNLKV